MTGLVAPEGLEGRRGDGTVHPLVPQVMGSQAWMLLQCALAGMLSVVDVFLIASYSRWNNDGVEITSSNVSQDAFAFASPFILVMLIDTLTQTMCEEVGLVNFYSSQTRYVGLLADCVATLGYYVGTTMLTANGFDPLSFRSGTLSAWLSWMGLARVRHIFITHFLLMFILFRVPVNIYRWQCWQASVHGRLEDKVKTTHGINVLLLYVNLLFTSLLVAVLQVMAQTSIHATWQGAVGGPKAADLVLSHVTTESDFASAAREVMEGATPSDCFVPVRLQKGDWLVTADRYQIFKPQFGISHSVAHYMAGYEPQDDTVDILASNSNGIAMTLAFGNCPGDFVGHQVARISFTGFILMSGLVIHMLGSSSVLMPLFNLMAVIVVAGGTLDDAGMLAEAGGSQGAESLTVERAVARVAKAIRLLGRATRNGRGVVARLMREARTDRNVLQDMGIMKMFGAEEEQGHLLDLMECGAKALLAPAAPAPDTRRPRMPLLLRMAPANLHLHFNILTPHARPTAAEAQNWIASRAAIRELRRIVKDRTAAGGAGTASARPVEASHSGVFVRGGVGDAGVSGRPSCPPLGGSSGVGPVGRGSQWGGVGRDSAPSLSRISQSGSSEAGRSAHSAGDAGARGSPGRGGVRTTSVAQRLDCQSDLLGTLQWDVLSLKEEELGLALLMIFEMMGFVGEEPGSAGVGRGSGGRAGSKVGWRDSGRHSGARVSPRGEAWSSLNSNSNLQSKGEGEGRPDRSGDSGVGIMDRGGGREGGEHVLVPRSALLAFIDAMRDSYDDHPYHCWRHAVDVTHSAFVLLILCWDWVQTHMSDLDVLCVLVACIGHDVHHRGVSNGFLCRTADALAITYNDKSVQEMMHAASLFTLMAQRPACNVFQNLPTAEQESCRATVIHLIINTDMAIHFQHTGALEIMADRGGVGEDAAYTRDSVMQVMAAVVHLADIGHALKPPLLHALWTERVICEFFREAEQLKAINVAPLPFMDQERCFVPAAQLEYLDFVVRPYLVALARVVPGLGPLRRAIDANYTAWLDCLATCQQAKGRAEERRPSGVGGEEADRVDEDLPCCLPGSKEEAFWRAAGMGLADVPPNFADADVQELKEEFRSRLGIAHGP